MNASKATTETLGTIKIGTGLKQAEDGTVSVDELKAATDTVLGGVKIGYTENNKNYAIKLDANNKAYVKVPWIDTKYNAASDTNLGLVKIGTGIKITPDGTISTDEVKVDTTSVLGGIKAGDFIEVSNTGDVTLPIMTTAEMTDLFNSVWYGVAN